jgi:hypothetical protein
MNYTIYSEPDKTILGKNFPSVSSHFNSDLSMEWSKSHQTVVSSEALILEFISVNFDFLCFCAYLPLIHPAEKLAMTLFKQRDAISPKAKSERLHAHNTHTLLFSWLLFDERAKQKTAPPRFKVERRNLEHTYKPSCGCDARFSIPRIPSQPAFSQASASMKNSVRT